MFDVEAYKLRLAALGQLVESSGTLEMQLRVVFCTLVGSKYAVIVAAGQSPGTLIDNIEAIAKAHREIEPSQRDAVLAALAPCKDLFSRRNRFIHGAWGHGPDGGMHTISSKYRKHGLQIDGPYTAADVDGLNFAILQAAIALMNAISGMPEMEAQLRGEDFVANLPPEVGTGPSPVSSDQP